MADQPKKKPLNAKIVNDVRRNGKPSKQHGASRNKSTHLTELQKALLGGGAMARITRRLPDAPKGGDIHG